MSGNSNQVGVAKREALSQGANPGTACLIPVARIGLGGHLQQEFLEAIVDYFLDWGGAI